jgi:transaldolase
MTSTTSNTAQLSAAGVSIWLDDLSRERITSGGLVTLIAEKNVVGVTTNPSIFAAALTNGASYAAQVAELAAAGKNVTEAVFEITTQDVANGCDIFKGIYDSSKGFDGRVSIEVEPGLANDAVGTIVQAKELYRCRHQRQRHTDLQPCPIPRRHQRVPRGPGKGQGRRA